MAKVTARIVHALEMEHVYYLPTSKRRRKRKRVLIVGLNHTSSDDASTSSTCIGDGDGDDDDVKFMMKWRRRKRKNARHYKPSYGYTTSNRSDNHDAIQSKKRQQRNTFMKQTYNERILLQNDMKLKYRG